MSAASALASTPARTTSTMARTSSQMSAGAHRSSLARAAGPAPAAPGGTSSASNWLLQREHLALVRRLGVVVAEQVEDPVRAEQVELLLHGPLVLDRLGRRDGRAEHNVTKETGVRPRRPRSAGASRPREGQHVGWARARPSSARAARSSHRRPTARSTGRPADGCPSGRARAGPAATMACSSTGAPGLVGDLDAHAGAFVG